MGIVVLQSSPSFPLSGNLALNVSLSGFSLPSRIYGEITENDFNQAFAIRLTFSDSAIGSFSLLNSFIYPGKCLAITNSFGQLSNIHFTLSMGPQDVIYIELSIRDQQIFIIHNQYGTYKESVQTFLNEIKGIYENRTSPYIQSIFLKLLNTDTLRSIESFQNALALEDNILSVNNIISEGFQDIIKFESSLSGSVLSNIAMNLNISSFSDFIQIHKLIGALSDIETKLSAIDYKIYLDGVDISALVVGDITIEKNQSNIHNAISFNSTSENLYNKANPADLYGEVRIEVHINNTVMFFLLEERTHTSDGTVTYWGRDATARDNAPYSPSVNIQLSEPTSAKDFCETAFVGMHSVIDWDILDWVLPASFESTGTPIEIISVIASELGAIVRAQDDGSINVRYVNPVRPIDLSKSTTDYLYYDRDIYDIEYSMEFGEGYTAVLVTADTDDKIAPKLEVEDAIGDSRIIGEDTYIRAYYYESPPESADPVVLEQDVTDGTIKFLSIGTEEITEIIQFQDSMGTSSYPLKNIKTITWLGRKNTIQTWDEYSTNITLENDSNCLAEITYDSEYYRYKASGHNVEELLAVFYITNSFISSVKVLMPDASKEGSEIVTSYLTTKNALSKRGEIWLDQNKYNEETVSFETPFVDGIQDGSIIWLEADRITPGKYQVYDSVISINGPKVVNTFTVKRWQV